MLDQIVLEIMFRVKNVLEQYVWVRSKYDRTKTVWAKCVKIKCVTTTLVRKNMLLQNVLEKTIGIVIISKYFFFQ